MMPHIRQDVSLKVGLLTIRPDFLTVAETIFDAVVEAM